MNRCPLLALWHFINSAFLTNRFCQNGLTGCKNKPSPLRPPVLGGFFIFERFLTQKPQKTYIVKPL
jgi:hypothetical protein